MIRFVAHTVSPMEFRLTGLEFEDICDSVEKALERGGVYVIWCPGKDCYKTLYVGESENIKRRLEEHSDNDRWAKECKSGLCFSIHYTDGLQYEGRRKIEVRLKELLVPLYGER